MICEAPSTVFPFPAFQFALDRFADQISPIFSVVADRIHPGKGAFWEPGYHILRPKFFSSHVDFSHMRY